MDFWKRIFSRANATLENLLQESCNCTAQPVHYDNIHLDLVPSYIEIKDNYAWDHTNDPDPNAGSASVNSIDKPYLRYIDNLARQSSGYTDGVNIIITTDGPFYNTYVSMVRNEFE